MKCGIPDEYADIASVTWKEEEGLETYKLVTEGNDGGLEIRKFENSNDENF